MAMAVNTASYKMKLFWTICLFLIIVTELLLVSKQINATVSHPPQVSLYVPVTIIFRYVNLQHNMTDIKQVHL